MKSPAVKFLLSNQNQDGGWGYGPQQSSAVEPTSAVLLALREDPFCDQSCRRAIDWLRSAQHPDGGWGFNSEDKESGWQTAWAVLALARTDDRGDALNRGAKWLLDVKTAQFDEDAMRVSKKILKIDPSLQGWSWLPGEAAFIEPTALVMLALASRPALADSGRIQEALQYLQDRRCQGGGWNIGNPFMFNSPLPARVHTTALVLLSLHGLAPKHIHPEDIKVLQHEMHRDGGVLGLAWGLLALETFNIHDTSAESRLVALQDKDGAWANNPYMTAVAIMAFRGYL